MGNEFEFFDIPGFHSRYEEIRTHDNDLVVEYVGVRQPVCDKRNAITLYTKSEKRIRVLNRFLKKIERMMNYDL